MHVPFPISSLSLSLILTDGKAKLALELTNEKKKLVFGLGKQCLFFLQIRTTDLISSSMLLITRWLT